MSDDGQRSIGGRLARAAVLVSSATLAVLLVLHSGPGCDGPTTAPASKPAAPAEQAQAQAQPAPTQVAEPQAPPVAAPQMPPTQPAVPADSKADDGRLQPNPPANPGNADAANNPRYFPASKAGVFIEPAPPANPPPQPQQQAQK